MSALFGVIACVLLLAYVATHEPPPVAPQPMRVKSRHVPGAALEVLRRMQAEGLEGVTVLATEGGVIIHVAVVMPEDAVQRTSFVRVGLC